MPQVGLGVRGVAGSTAGGLLAVAVWARRNPSPLPPWLHWMLDVPLPFVTSSRLREILRPAPNAQILEVGVGTGRHALDVARWLPSGRLTAFDIDDAALARVRKRAQRRGLANIELVPGDGARLPFAEAAFDAAYTNSVIGEIPDQEAALDELHRVVRPGGCVVFGETPPVDPHFVRLGALKERAGRAGFVYARHLGIPALGFWARFERP